MNLCWKIEQNNGLKMLACPSLPVSPTRELKHWIERIAEAHLRYTKWKFNADSQIEIWKVQNSRVGRNLRSTQKANDTCIFFQIN